VNTIYTESCKNKESQEDACTAHWDFLSDPLWVS